MVKNSFWIAFLFLLCLLPTVVQAETFLINGQVDETEYDDVLYLEHVDISVVEIHSMSQRRALSNDLQPNSKRYTLQLPNYRTLHEPTWYMPTETFGEIQSYEALRPTTIAVIDTGIAVDFLQNESVVAGPNFIAAAATPIDDHGHGTGLASVMLDVVGALPVQLVAVKAANSNGNFTVANIVKAIDYAIATNVDIINLSFGATTPHASEQQAIDKAVAAGITVVSSSGNNGQKIKYYPSSYPNVVSIGSINEQLVRSHFSTYNNLLDFVAPGEAMSVRRHDVLGTTLVEGTSFASAYFSATLGVVQSLSLQESAAAFVDVALDLGTTGYDAEYGHGYVDPLAAVLHARGVVWAEKRTSNVQKTWTVHFSNPLLISDAFDGILLLNEQLESQPIYYELVNEKSLAITPVEPLLSGAYWLVIPPAIRSTTTHSSEYPGYFKFVVE